MLIACPKCAAKLNVPPDSPRDKPTSARCPTCGGTFTVTLPASAPVQTETVAKVPPTLEALAPEDAAKALKHELPPSDKKPLRQTPKKIGNYDVIAEVNRGGMGIVYKAVDPQLRRQVAIKVLLAGEGAKEEDVKRFHREAQSTARLQHPNIVPIYATGTHEGKPYLVMDFVEGRTAKQIKEDGKMTPRLALSNIEAAADGLHHAHQNGVIHRDVKPANIIVEKSGRTQLMDFGLARRVDEDLEVTQSGTTMGTPSYMAPEQAEGKLDQVDARSDLYSAGACLYELLTGRPPFEANTIMATLKKVLDESPVPPRSLNPRIHRDVETICMKCLEKDPANRYANAKQLADDIRRFNAGEAITAKPLGFFWTTVRRARIHWEISAALLLTLCSSLAALGYVLNEKESVIQRERKDRESTLLQRIDTAQMQLSKARNALAALNSYERTDYLAQANAARAAIAEASATWRQAQALSPENSSTRIALDVLRRMDNDVEVRRFIYKARVFLQPPCPPGESPPPPNFAGAEFAAQEAVDRDPKNEEAIRLLNIARGFRSVSVDCTGGPADVYARRVLDEAGRVAPSDAPGLGKPLGRTPLTKGLGSGLYVLTFKRAGIAPQQATLLVTREARDEDLALKLAINTSEENMALIPAGSVALPQQGVAKVPAFAIDRFEYPNRAGAAPGTGVLSIEKARELCAMQGKTLCTAAQWLRACMGDTERRYPYGDVYVSRRCAAAMDADAQKTPMLSGQFALCRTPEGIFDMSGNVAEWTDTEQQESVFGGDYTSTTRYPELTLSCRARSLPEEVAKERRGFRCCKNK